MGSTESKLAQKVPEENPEEGSIPSTPILTPKSLRKNTETKDLDPRSPSKHIARTPIELLSAAADKLQSLTLNDIGNGVSQETPLKKHILLGTDPRSPTLEIQRTPIVVSASPDKKLPEKIRNKNLDKVLKCALLNTPDRTGPSDLFKSCPVTPKTKLDAYKRKSFVLLETNIDFTETNLDDVIKEKCLGKSLQNISTPNKTSYCEVIDPRSPTVDFLRTPIQVCKIAEDLKEKTEDIREHLVENDNKDDSIKEIIEVQNDISINMEKFSPAASQLEEPTIPFNKDHSSIENLVTTEVNTANITESSDSEKHDLIENTEQETVCTTIVLNEPNLNTCLVKTEEPITNTPCKNSSPTIVKQGLVSSVLSNQDAKPLLNTCLDKTEEPITMTPCKKHSPILPKQQLVQVPISNQSSQFPKSAPVSPPTVVSVTPKKSKSQPVTPPLIDVTADVKELDKKLTNLIYEDDDLVVCPRIVKMKDSNRTPLGLRNGTDHKKSTQKLKVSDKPRKAEYTVSKIPVFKDKKIKVQCENTPPRGMRGNAQKKSQWDAKDDTLVI